jgi:2-dehydro-3-deoxy-D-gluconate 5-dehydrogenase
MISTLLLQDRVALIVGVGGIGETLAVALAEAGARVAVADRSAERARSVSAKLATTGADNIALAGDITDAREANRLIDSTASSFGRIDGLINTVGVNVFRPLIEIAETEWDAVMAANLKGAFLISQAAARIMRDQETGGRIVHLGSVTALFGSPGQAVYAAAKAAAVHLVKSMALEWLPYGIRVNAISPVLTETDINRDWLDARPARRADLAARIPAGRLATPDDFVGPVLFLLSELSNFVFGQTLYVDGGTSVVHPLLGAASA